MSATVETVAARYVVGRDANTCGIALIAFNSGDVNVIVSSGVLSDEIRLLFADRVKKFASMASSSVIWPVFTDDAFIVSEKVTTMVPEVMFTE